MLDLDIMSKFSSMILRHKPEVIGIKLDEHGWGDVKEIIKGINAQYKGFNMSILEKIVATDKKQRYSFNEDKTKIRANQGHSVNVDVELEEKNPPDILYHGTATRFLRSIFEKGLLSMTRQYVHLSKDMATAKNVGIRHGRPAILVIDAKAMVNDGYKFYLSQNGVWLTKTVPPKYFKKV